MDFSAHYEQLYPRVYAYFRLRCPDAALAEDLASQVFERALRAWKRYDPLRAAFSTWVFSIAHNVLKNYWRRQALLGWLPWEAASPLLPRDPSAEEWVLQNETNRELLRALRQLGPREQNLLALKFGGCLSNVEIAAVTGLNANQVGVILYRAVHRLQELMQTREVNDGG
jgi:RNA polymerase sigma factor (sigma-70 family)